VCVNVKVNLNKSSCILSDCLIMDTFGRNVQLQHKLHEQARKRVKFHPKKAYRNKIKKAVDKIMCYFQRALIC